MNAKLGVLMFIISLYYFNPGIAQELEWQNTIGGTDDEIIYSIRKTTDNGFICGGWSSSNISPDKTEDCIGIADYWVVKLDSNGIIQWENTIGGTANDVLRVVEQSYDGGYICGGYSLSPISGDKTEGNIGYDYWIVKLDSLGNIEWENTIGGSDTDVLNAIKPTIDGGFICGGYSVSNASIDKSEMCLGLYDYWVVKLNSTGQIEWENTLGGYGEDEMFDIIQAIDGGYVCAGSSKSLASMDKSEDSPGRNFWIVKLDVNGFIQWENTIQTAGGDILMSIKQTLDAGFICGSYSDSPIGFDKTEDTHGSNDIWIVKLDSLGNIQWQNTIGTQYPDHLWSVDQTDDQGYICGGYSSCNINGDKTENRIGGAEDFWILKLDSTGKILWQNTIGGVDPEHLYSIINCSDDSYIAAGFSYSNISGDKTENSIGGMDYWVIKISDKYNLINGYTFLDDNLNSTFDAGETRLINKVITETTTGRIGITQDDGLFTIAVPDTGNFLIDGPLWNYYSSVPLSHNAYFNNLQQTDSLNDFAIQTTGVYNDLCISIVPIGNFRSGFNANYSLNYSNLGTTLITPTIIFYPDTNITFINSNVLASSITIDSVIWNLGSIAPFQNDKISISVLVDMGLSIGSLINSGAIIEPIAGDANTICNQSYWEILTTGSYDPNDILVSHDTLTTTEVSNGQYLDYIIRFQNTGNDTAFNVKLLNPIDTLNVDLSTFEVINSSHSVNINWNFWEQNMEFQFENILLPDSIVNEPLSHGFVRYRIQPKSSLSVGDSIPNFAAIFFDFNDPVVTNIAKTYIVLQTTINEIKDVEISLYPNPASDQLQIVSTQSSITGYEIFNLLGMLVAENQENSNQIKVNTSGLAQGLYFMSINTPQGKVYKKFEVVRN